MTPNLLCRDDREREVVQLWRSNRLSLGTLVIYLQWVHRFRTYCIQRGLDETPQLTLEGALHFAQDYTGPRKGRLLAAQTRHVARNALHAWACALRSMKVPVPPWHPKRPSARLSPLLAAYCQHRRSHCEVAEATLGRDLRTAKAFLGLLRSQGKAVSRVTVADVDSFIVGLSRRVSRSTVRDTGSSLRSFLRFLQMTGRLSRDLTSCVVTPRIRFAERPPRALPWPDVRRILGSIPQTQPPGKRDFAMLLAMATYGLGAAEVLGLCLEHVDWKSKVLRVYRPKTGTGMDLPLLPPVARALAAYLRAERPRPAQARRIFLRTMMPYDPITSGALRHRIRHYARRAGVTAEVIGAHAFRHSHASRQIDTGANLKVVSDILGHRRPSSTSVYIRVALRRLRSVALPVPR
jgi:site-specific recombinase XerD